MVIGTVLTMLFKLGWYLVSTTFVVIQWLTMGIYRFLTSTNFPLMLRWLATAITTVVAGLWTSLVIVVRFFATYALYPLSTLIQTHFPHLARVAVSFTMKLSASVVGWTLYVCECTWACIEKYAVDTCAWVLEDVCPPTNDPSPQCALGRFLLQVTATAGFFLGVVFLSHIVGRYTRLWMLRPVFVIPTIFGGLFIKFTNDNVNENDSFAPQVGGWIVVWILTAVAMRIYTVDLTRRNGALLETFQNRLRQRRRRFATTRPSRPHAQTDPPSTLRQRHTQRHPPLATRATTIPTTTTTTASTPTPTTMETGTPSTSFESTECIICFNDFEFEECQKLGSPVYLNCGHKFHDTCCQTWLNTNPTCPICRQRVTLRGRIVEALLT